MDLVESGYPEVAVTGGRLRGRRVGDVATFLGVPYAADTGGPNRFRPPQPVGSWSGLRDALHVGKACPQVTPRESVPMRPDVAAAIDDGYTDNGNMSEDCLNLNIWAPVSANDSSGLPVLVWLHGGVFTNGSGNLRRTDGSNLAKRGDVIVVAVNHRLGGFGYLHLGGLSNEPDVATAGNNGMLDIVKALEWVRDNIAGFGGDPDRVTVFGYSGGGFKVSALMGMPEANGLFHRAIAQSGFYEGADAAVSTEVARRMLDRLGVEPGDIDALRAVPADEIVRVQEELGGVYSGLSTVVDGNIIPAPVSESIRAGTTGQVPFIVGYAREDASSFLSHLPAYGNVTWENLPEMLQPVLGDRAPDALEVYRKARPDDDPTRLWAGVIADHLFGAPAAVLLEAHAADPARRTWAYVSTWTSPVIPDLYAGHGIEEVLYFDNAETTAATRDAPDGADLGRELSEIWVTFARDGDPNGTGALKWPEYELDKRATMIIDMPRTIRYDPFGAERGFWFDSGASFGPDDAFHGDSSSPAERDQV
ncbi:carboxylesterase family protein [Pseudonocardia kujensis]|uniref:carboxylesterase/lipase family protein n=1 Tax=Pseudonocardia kujensis TaxID=1128675 RepID=UPI001E2EF7C7|nr:carboxylesterase family protein [Pseudonocardia kujensis]MCE0767731.1 carboxylesterase family protein [Pseudonocardia kujensis]